MYCDLLNLVVLSYVGGNKESIYLCSMAQTLTVWYDVYVTKAQFHNNLIRLTFNPKIFQAKLYIFRTNLLAMLKAEYFV